MISYAERECFNGEELVTWCDAVDAIKRVGTWGNELRCHELARAMALHLAILGHNVVVVDGHLFACEHSWLVVLPKRRDEHRSTILDEHRSAILDVYCPGRMPQVQLIAAHFSISRGYEAGSTRVDIRTDILSRLNDELAKGLP